MTTTTTQNPFTTHNGTLTVKSTATGEHRTFRVRTWLEVDDDGKKQPKLNDRGEVVRVIELLTGSDNESSYTAFGFVGTDGTINVWRRLRGGQFERLAAMVGRLAEHEAAGRVEIHFAGSCRRCNRKLTTPGSIEDGIGPICAGRED